tara:strand:- start:2402 stop:2617 length:216 start_codon:yes stop_codon:yes gene_type:complete
MKKRKGISKNLVFILVIIAIILALFSISYYVFNLGSEVSTENPNSATTGGKIGIEIIPQKIEDKGLNDGGE